MLRTLDDVRRYTREVAERFPTIADEIVIRKEAIKLPQDLVTELGLPPKYCSVVESNNVVGVSLGFIALWPSFSVAPLEQSLREANKSESPARMFGGDTIVAVARYEANPICVASTANDAPESVFFLDTMGSPKWRIQSIAADYERFLILAANMHRISDACAADAEEGRDKMGDCCEGLDCSPEQSKFWLDRVAEMLT